MGLGAVPEVAAIAGQRLGWDPERLREEVDRYTARAEAELAAALEPDDASAVRVRDRHGEVTPLISMDR